MKKMTKKNLDELIEKNTSNLNGFEKEFFKRMWSSDEQIYIDRLQAIGFENLNNVLDAGCGFGQWTIQLSKLNKNVQGVELVKDRIKTTNNIKKFYNKKNLNVYEGSISKLPFKSNSFDGIFCYSAIYFTDYEETLKEFFRVLKPKGKLYFCTNDYGWYLYNLIEGHNPSKYFSQRKMARDTFLNTLKIIFNLEIPSGSQRILTKNKVIEILKKNGFINIIDEKEGGINFTQTQIKNFYPKKKYGLTNVYEILCEK